MDHVSSEQQHDADDAGQHAHRALTRIGATLGCLVLVLGFTALGVWQLERRSWKLRLIDNVEQRIHAPPVAPPSSAHWSHIGPDDAYRRVVARGVFLPGRETRVKAVTDLGAGWWVLSPLQTQNGVVLVNRGFVPQDATVPGPNPGPQTVVGLLRLSEPRGGFLRANAPEQDRWYSRDVAAIARLRRLGPVAPFFIDADASPGAGRYPRAGLTVTAFRNAHLAYALTWFGLAMLAAYGAWRFARTPPGARTD